MAAPWFGPIVSARTVHLRDADCTGAIRSALAGCASMTLTELREATGRRWSSEEMGAALAKLARRGEVVCFKPLGGKKRGKFYRWAACSI